MRNIGRYLLILIVVMALWNTLIIKPLKIFTVFLHELGHALMAFVFGYGIDGFKVNFNESGHTIANTKGWFSAFMITNGGYLGSVFFALLILYLKRTRFKKLILGSIAILFLVVSIRFSGLDFTLLYSIIFAVFVILLYMVQKEKLTDWVIDVLGVASVAYAIYDTFIDTVLLQLNQYFQVFGGWRTQSLTDAGMLAKLTHIPAILWGILWLCISLLAVNVVLLRNQAPAKSRKNK